MSNTACVEARVDIRALANLTKWFEENGLELQSRGELIRAAVELLNRYALKELESKGIDFRSTSEAYSFLSQKFSGASFNRRGAGYTALLRKISEELKLKVGTEAEAEVEVEVEGKETRVSKLQELLDLIK